MVNSNMTKKEFIDWLTEELNERGWSLNELARRAGLTGSMVSLVLSDQRNPGPDFCSGIAAALGYDDVSVFRKAGLLRSVPPPVADEDEMSRLFRRLSSHQRDDVLELMRVMAYRPGPRAAFTVNLESNEPDALAKLAEIWDRTPPSLRHLIPLILRDEVARYEAELEGQKDKENPTGDESTDGGDRVKCNGNGGEEKPGEEH